MTALTTNSLVFITLLLAAWAWQYQRVAGVGTAAAGEWGFGLYFAAATEEKTQPATPHRKREAREKGQVARSTDLNAAIVVIAVIIVVYSIRGYLGENISDYVRQILGNEMGLSLSVPYIMYLLKLTLMTFLKLLAPIFATAIVFGLLVNFFQVGMVVAMEGIKPKLSHINPIEGFKRIFSKRALVEFIKTLLKITIIGLITYNVVRKALPDTMILIETGLGFSVEYLGKLLFRVGITATGAFLVIAFFDLAYQKWEFARNMRMSVDEIKKEMKQTEGDPFIKAKLREKQRMMSMNRMMQSIPEATVVVTNPTHLAIALKYNDSMEAPQIVAKGAGYVAERIKESAREYKVPIVEDKPVAQSLYKSTEIGDYVPVELYHAVAGIIAAIYAMERNKRNGARS